MKRQIFNNIDLPSNYKFGYFFTFIFLSSSIYFYFKEVILTFYILGIISLVFFIITTFNADILKPLNKSWMSFGLVLQMIVSPIVLGTIFFIIFTPISILMRLFGRDELLLQFKTKPSYWANRNNDLQSNSFRRQF